MPRGIIMSISGEEAVILTRDSEFVKVALPKGEYDLGQEIEAESSKVSLVQKWLTYGGRRWAAVAAVLLIAIVLPAVATTVFLNNVVYAYVTLDINPSTEFSINGKERIIRVQPLNEEGAAVLEGSSLKGKDIEFGIEYFVERACELGFASAEDEGAVVATTVMEKEEDTALEERISATIDRTVEENKLNVKTGVLSATREIKEEADKAGVSAGKYLIALQASDDQLEVDIEDVKNSSIVSTIDNAGGNLESILKRAKKTNEELVKLFEKNQEKLRKNTDDNGRDDNGRDNNVRNSNGRNSGNNSRYNSDTSRYNNKHDYYKSNNNGRNDNEPDKKDNKGSSWDKWNGKSSGDNGRDNNSGRDNIGNRDNSTRDKNNGRDNSGRNGPNNGNAGNGQNKGNNRKQDELNNSKTGSVIKSRKNTPEVLEDIFKRIFNK
ncbi:MAG: anti-sigma factor domain-containing protein [Firmicutes bacterium]|nr:anti-sigma factor domain-containing protein [Bacillota bacterium]